MFFDVYFYMVVSFDYIKVDKCWEGFVCVCFDFVIVDEVYVCVGIYKGK